MPIKTFFGVEINYKTCRTYKISQTSKPNYYQRLAYGKQIAIDIPLTTLDPDPSGIIYVYSLENTDYTVFSKTHKTLYIGETHDQAGDVGGRFNHHIASPSDNASNQILTYAYNNNFDMVLDVYVLDGMNREDVERRMIENYKTLNGIRPIANGQD